MKIQQRISDLSVTYSRDELFLDKLYRRILDKSYWKAQVSATYGMVAMQDYYILEDYAFDVVARFCRIYHAH